MKRTLSDRIKASRAARLGTSPARPGAFSEADKRELLETFAREHQQLRDRKAVHYARNDPKVCG